MYSIGRIIDRNISITTVNISGLLSVIQVLNEKIEIDRAVLKIH
jgi:hypothetical protein